MRRAALCLTAAPCAVRAVAWLGRLAHPRAAILSGEAHSRVHERTAPTDAGSIGGNADTLVYREDGWRSRAPAARELRSHARLGAIKHDAAARQPAPTVSDRACVQEPTIGALCLHYAARSFAHSSAAACRPMDCCPCRPFATWSCAVARATTAIGPLRVLRAGKARRCQCRQNRYVASPSTVL
jgi:hypothetical protein